jgi:hypothetical protein
VKPQKTKYVASPGAAESRRIAMSMRSLKKLRAWAKDRGIDPAWAQETYDLYLSKRPKAEPVRPPEQPPEPPPAPADEAEREEAVEVGFGSDTPETRQVAYATTEDGHLAQEIAGLLMKRTGHGDTLTIKGVHGGYSLSLVESVATPGSFAEFFATMLGEAFGLHR